MVKVSVIMPVYNTREAYFREAIESVLNQSLKDFELLIVDDFSEPYIEKTVKSYKDERIKYHRLNKNSGASAACNFAIEQAQGEFIAFLDSDDISLENRLKHQLEYFEQNPQIGCLGTGVKGIGSEGDKIEFKTFSSSFEIELYLIFSGCAFCQSSVMLRKSILIDNNIRYQTKYVPAEDYGLWLDLIGYTQFYVLPEVLTLYRFYPENISHRQKDLQRHNSGLAQFEAFKKYCNTDFSSSEIWYNFMSGHPLGSEELYEMESKIPTLTETLEQNGCPKKDILYFFKKKFKKLYHKTRSLKGQWALMHSPLNKLFKIKFGERLFYLITRGIL